MKMTKKAFLVLYSVLLAFGFFVLTCNAAVELGENYVMYDMREYDGDSSLPYGNGSNGSCYYPRGDNTEYVFPEVYTWNAATLSETDSGVRLYANAVGAETTTTIDKVPAMYQQSVQRNFRYLILRIKANTTGENTILFSSPGGNYQKIYDVIYTGEWQSIVLDLYGTDGWEKKNADGSYSSAVAAPWESSHFGTDGFGIKYRSFGEAIKNDILIDCYVFTDDASFLPKTGKTSIQKSYIKGGTDGLFRPSDKLTRLQTCIIAARLLGYEDDDISVPAEYNCRFSDIASEDYGYKYIALLDSLGVLSVFDGELCVNAPICTGELCSILVKAKLCSEGDYPDYGILHSKSNDVISRAEACAVINQLTGRNTELLCEDVIFPDVSDSHSLYKDIYTATMSVNFKELSDGTTEVLAVYPEPDHTLTESVISGIDLKASALFSSIHNSKNSVTAYEKCYYVSPNGNDSNSGTSPNFPWKTLAKVNSVGFSFGSTVFFERGGLWRGSLTILPGVTYTAYGDGEKPTIYGSLYDGADASLWTLVEGTKNIWKFKYDMLDCGSVVFNHGEYHSKKEIPSYNGSIYLHRNSSKAFDYKTDISENLGIFCDNKRNLTADCPLYLRCDEGNPGDLFESIEFMPRKNIMNVVANADVVIDNFCLKYGGTHGIGAGTFRNLTVRNCEFYWIGGSIQNYNSGGGIMAVRYGNAIESYGAQDGFYVENNYIHQVYDAGITHQMSGGTQENGIQKNIRYANNLIEFCSYSVEYFLGEGEAGTPERYMENVIIEDNIMRYAGFGFGNQRTDRICMSHIKSGGGKNAVSEGFIIRNNIFDRSREMLINIVAQSADYLPRMSANTYIQYQTSVETPYSTLGKYGSYPARLRFYTADIKSIMNISGIETDAKVYFAKKDRLYELPEY